jgi:peptide deformylase
MSKRRESQILELISADNSILREKCKRLTREEILSDEIQDLIDDMKYTCDKKKYGVGLSANQVGVALAISIIAIKPTPSRPNLSVFDQVCINPEILETFGEEVPMWEGCQSTARDENGEPAMAQVMRFKKIRIKYLDRNGFEQIEIAEDFVAHVIQHEIDHLNGVLFIDLIELQSLITNKEYRDIISQDP